MAVLRDLDQAHSKVLEAVFIQRASQVSRILRKGAAATAAGSNGAIHIYTDTFGEVRCESMRYYVTIDKQIFSTIKLAKPWINEWLQKIK